MSILSPCSFSVRGTEMLRNDVYLLVLCCRSFRTNGWAWRMRGKWDGKMCSYLTERHFQGFFYTRRLYLIMASYGGAKGCFVWYVCKDVYKMWSPWGTISQNHEGCECHPILTLMCSICKANMSKTFCTSLYDKYIVYFYLNVVCLLLFDLEFSEYSWSQNKSGCMLQLGASISLRGQRVERSSPKSLGVVRCPPSVHCWCLVSCLPQALWHKDKWQGQSCQYHSAGTPTNSHSNGASGKRKMTPHVFDRRWTTVLCNSCGWSSVWFVYHHWSISK